MHQETCRNQEVVTLAGLMPHLHKMLWHSISDFEQSKSVRTREVERRTFAKMELYGSLGSADLSSSFDMTISIIYWWSKYEGLRDTVHILDITLCNLSQAEFYLQN